MIFEILLSDVYKVLCWHNLQGHTFEEMSYRKILKSKGPKIDPFGTPLSTFPHSLKELFVLLR